MSPHPAGSMLGLGVLAARVDEVPRRLRDERVVAADGISQADLDRRHARDEASLEVWIKDPKATKSPSKASSAVSLHSQPILSRARGFAYPGDPGLRHMRVMPAAPLSPVRTAVDACAYVVDQAVQLHGGMGYMRESEVERHYRDARVLGIGGGATEVMTDLVARLLGY